MQIRDLQAGDRAQWQELWDGFLRFYRVELAADITELTFTRMTEQRDGCFGLAAEADDGALAGFAHCVLHPTSWSLQPTCYLEDLFVGRNHRGTGAARALIEVAGERGKQAGAETLYWHTQAFNGAARSLYDTVAKLSSWVHYERELS